MIVPRFFIVEPTGPGRVTLHGPVLSTPPGSRDPTREGRPHDATISSEARSWKDVFGVNFLEFLISESVAEAIRRSDLKGIALFPARLVNIEAQALAKTQPPTYYWTQLRRGIQVETEWEHGERRSIIEFAYRGTPIPETWSGEDLFLAERGSSFGQVLCTRRFLKAAHDNKWNGLRFYPMDVPRPYRILYSNAVDYLKRQWPPKLVSRRC